MNDIRHGEIAKLVLSILICQAAGIAGSFFTASSVDSWYPSLIKPAFTPPGWVIGLVWIFLFTLMGIALFLVWREGIKRPAVKAALTIFAVQLAVNVLWSLAFFGLKSPLAGIVVIVVLWVLILLTIVRFLPLSRVAALLMVPYILWVSFAAFLNISIWWLNL
jgi:benzodiazapine receptor